ncbi:MAG: DUF4239 domain-containing protein [Nanoarchaeota archaeon]|nr:DUF4239 domain-containing protein [Nanoarchaeota archaeon]MBU4072430.1 DUF4239 domain-containing protein [Candidatus Thermoplasmatota archaeon]
MKYKSYILILVLLIISFSISFLNPFGGNAISDEMKIIFSFTGMMFAILSGFFIASSWDRYTKLRTLLAVETASLENIYKFYEIGNKKAAKKVANLIDKYLIKSFEFGLHEHQEQISEEYFAIYDSLKYLKGPKATVPLTRIMNVLDNFTKARKEIISRMKDKLGIYHWIILLLLETLLIITWIHIQFAGPIGIIIGTVLVFSLFTILMLIYDLSNLDWGIEQVNIEVYERVYDVIGLMRYYPEELLSKVSVPKKIKSYRVGILIDPITYKRKIKIIKNN